MMKAKVVKLKREADGTYTVGFLVKTRNFRYVYHEENVRARNGRSAVNSAIARARTVITDKVNTKESLPSPNFESRVGNIRIKIMDFFPVITEAVDGWTVIVSISSGSTQTEHGFFISANEANTEDDIIKALMERLKAEIERIVEDYEIRRIIGEEFDLQ